MATIPDGILHTDGNFVTTQNEYAPLIHTKSYIVVCLTYRDTWLDEIADDTTMTKF